MKTSGNYSINILKTADIRESIQEKNLNNMGGVPETDSIVKEINMVKFSLIWWKYFAIHFQGFRCGMFSGGEVCSMENKKDIMYYTAQ